MLSILIKIIEAHKYYFEVYSTIDIFTYKDIYYWKSEKRGIYEVEYKIYRRYYLELFHLIKKYDIKYS